MVRRDSWALIYSFNKSILQRHTLSVNRLLKVFIDMKYKNNPPANKNRYTVYLSGMKNVFFTLMR